MKNYTIWKKETEQWSNFGAVFQSGIISYLHLVLMFRPSWLLLLFSPVLSYSCPLLPEVPASFCLTVFLSLQWSYLMYYSTYPLLCMYYHSTYYIFIHHPALLFNQFSISSFYVLFFLLEEQQVAKSTTFVFLDRKATESHPIFSVPKHFLCSI